MGEGIINLFKFFVFLVLIPVVIAISEAFVEHFDNLPSSLESFLLWGAIAFLITFLFVHSFRGVYNFGQKIIESIFKFLAPLDVYISGLIPFYTVLIVLVLFICDTYFNIAAYRHYFIFFIGFTAAMHLILMAQQFQEQEKSLFKPTYFLMVSIIFILNVMVAVLILGVLSDKFIFPDFMKSFGGKSWGIYTDIVKTISQIKK